MLTKKGLTIEDREEAFAKTLEMYGAAEKRLGGSPNDLIGKPKDPAKLGEWMRENAETLGLPKEAEGYAIGDLTLPEGMTRDTDLEAAVQKIAFDHGVPPAAHKAMVEAYAERMGTLFSGVDEDLAVANQKMETELKGDWGNQYGAKVQQAQQAFSLLAQQAKLDADTQTAMFASLKEKGGDASVMRLFAAVGAMMGEDSLAQGTAPALAMTPADARATAAQMRSPDGDYGKAYAKGDRAEMARLGQRAAVARQDRGRGLRHDFP